MAIQFPTNLDTFVNPNAAAGDDLNSPLVLHDAQHSNDNDAIVALETKVGIDNSAVASTLDYQAHNHAHTGSDGSVQVELNVNRISLADDYAVTILDDYIGVTDTALGPFRGKILLPACAAVGAKKVYFIKDESGQADQFQQSIQIVPNGTDTFQGGTLGGSSISTAFGFLEIISDGIGTWYDLDAGTDYGPTGPAGGDLSGTYPNPDVVDDSHSHTSTTTVGASGSFTTVDLKTVTVVNGLITSIV